MLTLMQRGSDQITDLKATLILTLLYIEDIMYNDIEDIMYNAIEESG